MLGSFHADEHIVEIRGERCHGRSRDRRCHRRFLVDQHPPRSWHFHQYAPTVHFHRHLVDPLRNNAIHTHKYKPNRDTLIMDR